PRVGHPEAAVVIDREPLEAVGDAGEALIERAGRDAQIRCVDAPHRFQLGEMGKLRSAGMEQIDVTLESAIRRDGCTERVQRLACYGGAEFVRGGFVLCRGPRDEEVQNGQHLNTNTPGRRRWNANLSSHALHAVRAADLFERPAKFLIWADLRGNIE